MKKIGWIVCLGWIALALTGPVVAADGDLIPDLAEQAACGFPTVSGTVNSLPPVAGRCVTGDYISPVFEASACTGCDSRVLQSATDQQLTPSQDVGSQPLPPVSVPTEGPFSTPPVNQVVATVQANPQAGDPTHYCVTITPAGGNPLSQCFDLGAAGPFVPPVPSTPIGSVQPVTVGPTPGIPSGSLGSTPPEHAPRVSVDVSTTMQWLESRLNQRFGPGLVNVWEPYDADSSEATSWFVNNGQSTSLHVTITPRLDGVAQQSVNVYVPYAGQVLAAQFKNTGL